MKVIKFPPMIHHPYIINGITYIQSTHYMFMWNPFLPQGIRLYQAPKDWRGKDINVYKASEELILVQSELIDSIGYTNGDRSDILRLLIFVGAFTQDTI